MEHWFDRVAKAIAERQLSRRTVMSASVGSAVGFLPLPSPSGISRANASRDRCTRGSVGTRTDHEVSIAERGLTLRQTLSFDRSLRSGSLRVTVRNRWGIVFASSISISSERQITCSLEYGLGFRGVRNAAVIATPTRHYYGEVDNRRFRLEGPTDAFNRVIFSDGRPSPRITVSPEIEKPLKQILARANVELQQCSLKPLDLALSPTEREPAPAGNYVPPGSHGAWPCDKCLDEKCNGEYVECLDPRNRSIFDWFNPLTYVELVGGCLIKNFACYANCYVPGQGCCPVKCGTLILDDCCTYGQICLGDIKQCCPAGQAVCGGVCCDYGVSTCAPDGTCGCPDGQAVCGADCCPPGQTCCGDKCCPSGHCYGDTCCAPPNHMCGSICCGGFDKCCNGACCSGKCNSDGSCCPMELTCGPVCCEPGTVCLEPAIGRCSNRVSQCVGRSHVECASFSSRLGRVVDICCPRGWWCYGGTTCCPIGTLACSIGGVPSCCRIP